MKLFFFTLVSLFSYGTVVHAQLSNITVDDTDPRILYSTGWTPAQANSLDSGDGHSLSTHPTATATLQFTGIAVYFWAPLWPYAVNTMLSVDGQSGQCVDLQDHSRPATGGGSETVQSAVVWSMAGLSNTQHTLTVSMCPNAQFVILDAISFTEDTATTVTAVAGGGNTVPNNPTLPPPSSNPTLQPQTVTVTTDGTAFTFTYNAFGSGGPSSGIPSASSTGVSAGSQGTSTKSSSHTIAIAVGAGVGGFSFLAAVVLLSAFFLRRKPANAATVIPEDGGAQDSSASLQPAPSQMSNAPLVAGNQVPVTHGMMNHHPYAAPYDHMNPQQLVPGQYTSWAGTPMSHPSTLTPITEGSPYSQLAARPNLPEV